jgi:hypothetical protein
VRGVVFIAERKRGENTREDVGGAVRDVVFIAEWKRGEKVTVQEVVALLERSQSSPACPSDDSNIRIFLQKGDRNSATYYLLLRGAGSSALQRFW